MFSRQELGSERSQSSDPLRQLHHTTGQLVQTRETGVHGKRLQVGSTMWFNCVCPVQLWAKVFPKDLCDYVKKDYRLSLQYGSIVDPYPIQLWAKKIAKDLSTRIKTFFQTNYILPSLLRNFTTRFHTSRNFTTRCHTSRNFTTIEIMNTCLLYFIKIGLMKIC